MRRTILLLVVLLSAANVFAQIKDDTLLYDDFTDNGLRWFTKSENDSYLQVEGGSYVCKYTGSTWYVTWDDFAQVNFNSDMTYEATLTSTDGGEMGLIWAADGLYNSYYFTTKGNKAYFYTYENETTQKKIVLDEGSCKNATTKTLKIEKVGTKVTFYINGEKIFKETVTKYPGVYFGFAMIGKSSFKVDKVYIKNPRTINLAPNMKPCIIENLGMNVNSIYNEYSPVITPDGKGLYFIGDDNPNNIGGVEKQDIYYSEFVNGNWTRAKNVGAPLNNKGHNGVFAVSPDGNTLLLLNKYNTDGSMSSGVSLTHRTKTGWAAPENQTLTNFTYGDYGYTDYSLSANGKILFLAVEGKNEGMGQRDLHVSFLLNDKSWTKPLNMGKILNTRGDEQAPFLAADGVTLYFSSDGHPGFGDADIYMTKRLDNSWTSWSKPVNLGRPINGRGYDGFYTLPASGEFAYISSAREKKHGSDIFRVKLQPEIKPDPVMLIHGKVLNILDNSPVFSTIHYEDLDKHVEIGMARTDYNHAEYKLVLPYGEHIGVRAEAEGFISVSESFDIKEKKDYIEITKNLYMMPISPGKKMNMNNVFFVQSKPELLPTSYPELDRLVGIMKKFPKMQVEIHGHTDNQGNAADNVKLSQERCEAVKTYLTSKGVEGKRITGKGHGGSMPVAPNDKEENRKLNRRVEFEITKM